MALRKPRVSPRTQTTDLLVLDAQAVSLAADQDTSVQAWLACAQEADADVVVSAATVAEVVRGTSRDATVHRVLKTVEVLDVDGTLARAAGALLGAAGTDATVDALVVATAVHAGDRVGAIRRVVLTSDEPDIAALAEVSGRTIVVARC